jgi:SAM-dependent methyltransferase
MARAQKDYLSRYYPETRFGGFTRCDGTIAFYTRVQTLVEPSSVVLDIGCGRGAYAVDPVRVRAQLRVLRGKCRRVIGIDVDPQARDNPCLDEFCLIEGPRWPVADASVDLSLCDCVLEHVAQPGPFFSECRRTLRPGGYLCLRTSNARNYVSLFARLIPNHFHARVLDRVLYVRKRHEDIFPTWHRCNTVRRIRRSLDRCGFEHCVYTSEAEPYHLGFARWAYLCGVLHQRFAPRPFRSAILAFARKK